MYRILSLDGGGIRGLLTLGILKELEAQYPSLLQNIDLFAGTSTGGIIALGLASGKSINEMIDLYRNNGEDIFDDTWLDNIADLGGVAGAEYDNKNLKKVLKGHFNDKKLSDILPKKVVIPTFNLDNNANDLKQRSWGPKFFHNFPGGDSDSKELVVDVAMRTSAAPTYFPTYQTFVDGGVVANNPSMAALAQTQDFRNEGDIPSLTEIRLLSIGTGTNLSYVKGQNLDWGFGQWAKPLISLLLDANMGISDFQCRQLLRDNYCRIAPVFPHNKNYKLDDWKKADELLTFGKNAPLMDSWSKSNAIAWLSQMGW